VADAQDPEPLDPVALLEVLARHQVRFVVIGGIAALSHGYPLPTEDVDVTPARDRANLERLAAALRELEARLHSTSDPAGVPFPAFDDPSGDATVVDLGTERPLRVPVASLAESAGPRDGPGDPRRQE
jgi:hypothetical protein